MAFDIAVTYDEVFGIWNIEMDDRLVGSIEEQADGSWFLCWGSVAKPYERHFRTKEAAVAFARENAGDMADDVDI